MRFELAKEAGRSSFATRSVAAEFRTRLSAQLSRPGNDNVLELSFAGVEALTVSFADELVAKLAAERRAYGAADAFLLISDASEEVAETIEVALERRGLFVVHRSPAGELDLMAAPEHLKETYAVAVELGQFHARDLAERMNLKAPAANNRIKALAEAGALARVKETQAHGGRQFSYQAGLAA